MTFTRREAVFWFLSLTVECGRQVLTLYCASPEIIMTHRRERHRHREGRGARKKRNREKGEREKEREIQLKNIRYCAKCK